MLLSEIPPCPVCGRKVGERTQTFLRGNNIHRKQGVLRSRHRCPHGKWCPGGPSSQEKCPRCVETLEEES